MSKSNIVQVLPDRGQKAEELPNEDPATPAVGKWYWITSENKDRWFGCVIQIGSNYIEIKGAGETRYSTRIHMDEFWDVCEFEPDPDAHIDSQIEGHRKEVQQLIGKVREITARLAITPGLSLPSGAQETQALVLRDGQPVEEYKAALVRAKDEELPELFKKIKEENRLLGEWMKAKLIPLEAQADLLEPAISAVKERIFSVELYAGLVEQVVQVRDGDPAPLETKVHLIQRRCYMDEECLANYQVGGMDFKNIRGFDKWLGKKDNLNRILPFPRCIAAFQVRRNVKYRQWHNVREYFRMVDEAQLDKLTFLYIRNGDQLFRLNTSIDFGSELFPDMTLNPMEGKSYAKASSGGVSKIISEGEYLEMVREEEEQERLRKKAPKKEQWHYSTWKHSEEYKPFTQDNVYYDDILKHIQAEMARHNRLVLVLQGLFDRSPVLHPHPPWSLWNGDSFKAALELVYDNSRALTPGDAPDFEAYVAKCNESLKTGSVTVGQEEAWERAEAKKECARIESSSYGRSDYRPERFRPHGNPGPGNLARVNYYQPKTKVCSYAWNRERLTRGDSDDPKEIRCTFSCKSELVLNVDAYKPGDFKIFFSDPRTRADYLEWAPLLLEAEEYHAGNRKVEDIPEKPPVKEPSWEGQRRYAMRKKRKALLGKAVKLTCDIETKGGLKYKKGSLWRVVGGQGDRIDIRGINPDGSWDNKEEREHRRFIREVHFSDVVQDDSVPEFVAEP